MLWKVVDVYLFWWYYIGNLKNMKKIISLLTVAAFFLPLFFVTSATVYPENPEYVIQCKKGGWKDFNFRNQGQCIRYINTGKDSR